MQMNLKKPLQIVYLGWFLGDWSLVNNGLYSCSQGLKPRSDTPDNTGDLFGISSLDEDWVTLNQMIKYYKFGFGRATDYVNEEIRLNRMSRDEGIQIVEKYDGACSDEYIESFGEYIGISVDSFWQKVKLNINKNLFEISDNGEITPKFKWGKAYDFIPTKKIQLGIVDYQLEINIHSNLVVDN